MNWKQILAVVGISAGTAVGSVMVYTKMTSPQKESGAVANGKLPANYVNYTPMGGDNGPADFTSASQTAVPAVVHIKTKTKAKTVSGASAIQKNPFFDDPIFERFFNDDMFGQRFQRTIPEQRASGSGVFISADGYIITNNHVVEGADEVKVTLSNKKTYVAKVIGTDPASDLAVIKVEGSNFPYLVYGNSDDVKLGQWVLAVGYPLTLDCSVTAGIVSAKARSLGLNDEGARQQNKPSIESYIQTDAAVNKGNSGGALVNTRGELIGINSAIASPTGFYAGYSYAIPVNIAKKIAADLMKHGTAQRAYLGVRPASERDSDGSFNLKDGKGVELRDVSKGGAADAAGLVAGDIITKINGRDVKTYNEMVEQLASYSVGDKISVSFLRGNKENTVSATLKNEAGNFEVVTQKTLAQQLGAELENLDAKKAREYGIEGGVVIRNLTANGLLKSQNPSLKKGLVIIRVNGNGVNNIEELAQIIEANTNSTVIQGFYPGSEGVFTYVINKNNGDDE
jgi:serine protease Do